MESEDEDGELTEAEMDSDDLDQSMCNGCMSPTRDLKDPGNVTGDSGR